MTVHDPTDPVAPDFELTVAARDGVVHLTLQGEVDHLSAGRIADVDIPELCGVDSSAVVVDLHDVDFIDSSGIGALVALRNRSASTGASFVVVVPDGPVCHTLTLAGLAEFLGVRSHETLAVQPAS